VTKKKCPIVVIGASAGGLDALRALFQTLPTQSGAAFVIIQHLDPAHESLTAEILSRSTSMETIQITQGMMVEPNHVYVIPPNTYLTLNKDAFVLKEPILDHGLRLPINNFLISLTQYEEGKVIAIIVSGTGHDGSAGLSSIKGNCGLVMVQEPTTAQYDGMPRSAIDTGLVDIVCPVEEMASHLTSFLENKYIAKVGDSVSKINDDVGQLNSILALILMRTGHDFKSYKPGTLSRRIGRRMGLQHIDSYADYLLYLREHDDEVSKLLQDLLISVTAFFRDSKAFEALYEKAIKPIIEKKDEDQPIRIWVPGCATGEEAYSIAMLLIERLDTLHKHCPIQIFASDIDENAISIGRAGLYPQSVVSGLSQERLYRFFTLENKTYRVNKSLRDCITFANQNLISDPPFSTLDLISCRNLMIYLITSEQRKLLALFHFALCDDGYLFLGHSETATHPGGLFDPLSKKWRIYHSAAVNQANKLEFPLSSRVPRSKVQNIVISKNQSEQSQLEELVQHQLIQEYAPAAVLVNQKYQILYFSGPTNRYLEQPIGAPTQDLLSLSRHELRASLRGTLKQVVNTRKLITVDNCPMVIDGTRFAVRIVVKPLLLPRNSTPLYLITFADQSKVLSKHQPKQIDSVGSTDTLVKQLEDELYISREELQSNIEEFDSANEELQAASEEVMSVNEELQSSNEELETSKEELQAMNEELTTVNNQLKNKMEELSIANDDLENLLNSTDIATIFIDAKFNIGRFTPATKELLNLISSDIGRPLIDIRPKFTDENLMVDVEQVLAKLTPLEAELKTENGRCFLRRISPYRTSDNRIEGVVITFVDITARIIADEQMRRLATVVRDSNDALMVHDLNGKITHWNKGAQLMYGWSEDEALKKTIFDLVLDTDVATTKATLQRIKDGEFIESLEAQRITKDGHVLDVWVTITCLTDDKNKISSVATTERDITQRKQSDEKLQAARTIAESALAAKSRFLATASHDLRQPLQSLILLNETLLKSEDKVDSVKILTMQKDSLYKMSQLLNSLLDISKLESGIIKAIKENVKLQSILNHTGNEFAAIASEKGLDLIIEKTDAIVHTDPLLLLELIQNLVENAIRYTNNGFVKLVSMNDENGIRLEVRDTGVGIAPDQQTLIFDEFHQSNRDSQMSNMGLGLGLSIVQRIAALLGTSVELDSELNHGSVFSIILPLAETDLIEVNEVEVDNQNTLNATHGGVVLILDDDLSVLDATRMLLETEAGIEIVVASSPTEVYSLIKKTIPDLIISDFHIHHKDTGIDVIEKVRKLLSLHIPGIIVTGDTSLTTKSVMHNDVELITKPTDPDELISLVNQLLASKLI
jgi:two-component system CheB/CheR fusion protein